MFGLTKTQIKSNPSLPLDTSMDSSAAFRRFNWPIAVGIFVLAATIRLWFNFGFAHIVAATSCDGYEYLSNAASLQTFLGKLFANQTLLTNSFAVLCGRANANQVLAVKHSFQMLADFAISGPTFPLFLASCYQVLGKPVEIANTVIPVVAQSLLSASTASLLYAIGTRVWNRQVGVCAGILAALYPAFIINCGRLYPETFAAFLLMLIAYITVHELTSDDNSTRPPNRALILGMLLACLQLTRSIMAVLTIALLPITFFQQKPGKRILATMLVVLGFVIAVTPWLVFQKLAFGTASVVVDRVGHYNFFVGNNIGSSGYLSIPYPDGHGIENKSFATLAINAIKQSPSSWIKLMADKPARLFKFPWNDFKQAIGIVGHAQQVLIHQLIILAAILGLIFSFATKPQLPADKQRLFSRLFLLALLSLHCLYMLFITVPRYNLTAMPVIILFAACGIIRSFSLATTKKAPYLVPASVLAYLVAGIPFAKPWQLSFFSQPGDYVIAVCLIKALALLALIYALWQALDNGGARFAKILLVVLLALAGPAYCLPIRSHGPIWQWQIALNQKGQSLVRQITLSPKQLAEAKSKQCYLLVDSESARDLNNGIAFSINGQAITAPLIPGLSLVDDQSTFKDQGNGQLYLEGGYIFDSLSRGAEKSNLDLRQWFLLPIDPALLNNLPANETLKLKVQQTSNIQTNFFGSYQASKNYLNLPSVNLYSWEKAFYGVENNDGLSDTRYDTKIATNGKSKTIYTQGTSTTEIPAALALKLLSPIKAADAEQFLTPLKSFAVGNINLASDSPVTTVSLTELPKPSNNQLWLVRLSGSYQRVRGNMLPSVQVSIMSRQASGKSYTYNAPWMPQLLGQKQNNEAFDIAFPVYPSALPGLPSAIALHLNPTSPVFNHYNKRPALSGAGTFKNLSLTIYHLPIIPTSPGWNIY